MDRLVFSFFSSSFPVPSVASCLSASTKKAAAAAAGKLAIYTALAKQANPQKTRFLSSSVRTTSAAPLVVFLYRFQSQRFNECMYVSLYVCMYALGCKLV